MAWHGGSESKVQPGTIVDFGVHGTLWVAVCGCDLRRDAGGRDERHAGWGAGGRDRRGGRGAPRPAAKTGRSEHQQGGLKRSHVEAACESAPGSGTSGIDPRRSGRAIRRRSGGPVREKFWHGSLHALFTSIRRGCAIRSPGLRFAVSTRPTSKRAAVVLLAS